MPAQTWLQRQHVRQNAGWTRFGFPEAAEGRQRSLLSFVTARKFINRWEQMEAWRVFDVGFKNRGVCVCRPASSTADLHPGLRWDGPTGPGKQMLARCISQGSPTLKNAPLLKPHFISNWLFGFVNNFKKQLNVKWEPESSAGSAGVLAQVKEGSLRCSAFHWRPVGVLRGGGLA